MTSPKSRYVGGALDLAALKEQAEARAASQQRAAQTGQAGHGGGVAPFFEVTESNFEDELIRRSAQVPVIAVIGSARSPESEQLKNDFQELAQAGGLKFVVGYIDADAYPGIAQVFGLQVLPTTIAIAAGQPVTNFEGAQPKTALQNWLDTLVQRLGPKLSGLSSEDMAATNEPEPEDPRLAQAEEFLARGDFDGAIGVYDAILASEPHNAEIRQARTTTILLKRLESAHSAGDPIANADADLSDVNAQMIAADAEVVAGNAEAAFARLIAAMKTTGGEDKKLLKARLLELFALFDASDPRVLTARTQLASVLF
ncbi:MAG: tetratricopeptide repeat protein [Corynebacterium sp.]|nr:tetratricopeptide repeat protein [Corynebacterium sp.]